jgi:hypothetical protein
MTSLQHAIRGPIVPKLVRRGGKWDKEDRNSLWLCPGIDLGKDKYDSSGTSVGGSQWAEA